MHLVLGLVTNLTSYWLRFAINFNSVFILLLIRAPVFAEPEEISVC